MLIVRAWEKKDHLVSWMTASFEGLTAVDLWGGGADNRKNRIRAK